MTLIAFILNTVVWEGLQEDMKGVFLSRSKAREEFDKILQI